MNDVKYHKFTGGVPIIFVENFKDFPTAIGAKPEDLDEGAQFDDGNYCRTIGFKKSPLKFIVFEDAMMRTLFGHRRNDVVDATLAMYVAEQKYPMNPKLAMNHAIKLTIENNAVGAYQMLNSTYTRKFKSENPYHQIAIQEGLIEEAERTSADMKVSDEIERRKLKSVDGYGSLWSRSGSKPVEYKKEDGKLVPVSPDDPINQEDGEKSQQTVADKPAPNQPTEKTVVLKNTETGEIVSDPKKIQNVTDAEEQEEDPSPEFEHSKQDVAAIQNAKAFLSDVDMQGDDGSIKESLMSIMDKIQAGSSISAQEKSTLQQWLRPSTSSNRSYTTTIANQFAQTGQHKREKIKSTYLNRVLVNYGIEAAHPTMTTSDTGKQQEALFKKKELNPATVFSDGKETTTVDTPVEASKNGFKIDNHEVKTIKQPSRDQIIKELQRQGLEGDELETKATDVEMAVRKHNNIVTASAKVFAETGSMPMVDVLPGVTPDTPEGRSKLQYASMEKLQKTLAAKVGADNKIVKQFDMLKTLKGEEFEVAAKELIHQMWNDPNFKTGVADLVEIISYAKALANDRLAYIPAASNFKLGDIITFSPDMDTTSTKGIIEAAQLLIVSADKRSVKKGAGGKSETRGKIELSEFTDPDVKEDLMSLDDSYDMIFNSDDLAAAKKHVFAIAKKYGISPRKILSETVMGKTRAESVRNLAKKVKKTYPEVNEATIRDRMAVYMVMGNVMEQIYNQHIKMQMFSNERYTDNKSGTSIDLSDGVTRIATLRFGFNTGTNSRSGAPGNPVATGMHHVDRTTLEASRGNK